jgi:hypothetical protein
MQQLTQRRLWTPPKRQQPRRCSFGDVEPEFNGPNPQLVEALDVRAQARETDRVDLDAGHELGLVVGYDFDIWSSNQPFVPALTSCRAVTRNDPVGVPDLVALLTLCPVAQPTSPFLKSSRACRLRVIQSPYACRLGRFAVRRPAVEPVRQPSVWLALRCP